MSVSYPTKVQLAFRSGDRCAFPGCTCSLVVESESGGGLATVGEAAHIAGEKANAARYDPNMTDDERDHYNNLIYLCPNHHTLIDDEHTRHDYPVPTLLTMKKVHETKVRESINNGFAEVAFPELAEATERISMMVAGQPSEDFASIPPEEKIRKNELSSESEQTLRMGLAIVREVREYVKQESVIDADFPERLKSGFLEEYYRLRKQGHKGDILFDLMCSFAQRGMKKQAVRSAGLGVLAYLFDLCEVFEK